MKQTRHRSPGLMARNLSAAASVWLGCVGAWNGIPVHYARSVCISVPGKVYLPREAATNLIRDAGCSCSFRSRTFSTVLHSFLGVFFDFPLTGAGIFSFTFWIYYL